MVLHPPGDLDPYRIRLERVPRDGINDPLRPLAQLDDMVDDFRGGLGRIFPSEERIVCDHLNPSREDLLNHLAAGPHDYLRDGLNELPGFPGQLPGVARAEAEQGDPG